MTTARPVNATRKDERDSAVVPGPRGDPLLGSARDMRRDLLQTFMEGWREYGDVSRLRLGPTSVYLVFHPDGVHHVLSLNKENYRKGARYQTFALMLGQGVAMSEGGTWERQRRLLQPLFTPRQVNRFVGVVADTTDAMLKRWESAAQTGQAMDIFQEMMMLTMSVITQTMFSKDMADRFAATGPAFRTAVNHLYQRVLAAFPLPPGLPTPANRRFNRAMRTLDEIVYNLIDERSGHPGAHDDLLSVLIGARDDETAGGMSRELIRDQILNIFLAGHETTANALSWTWYLLSAHPEIERAFHTSVQETVGDQRPSAEDLPRFAYVEMVLQETLRLYPPVYVLSREAIHEDEIGGYRVPAGATVALAPYVTHRIPSLWENPEGFDPLRFTAERIKNRPRYAYFPFGGGPRQCLGFSFAIMEAQIVAAMISQRFRLDLVPGRPVVPHPVGTLQPRDGLLMTVHRR